VPAKPALIPDPADRTSRSTGGFIMEIRLWKASESGESLFLTAGTVWKLFYVASNFELMSCHFLKSNGYAPQHR
jgi:hypothetical protein